jgi:hypothetical protein
VSVDVAYLHIKRAIESNKECFLCTLEDEIESKFIDTYLSELVMNASSREKITESRGFCNHHFYKTLIASSKPKSSDGHGMALIMQSVTERLIQDLHRQRNHHEDAFHVMIANEKCPACVHLAEFMEIYVKMVMELLSSHHKEFLKLFMDSKGLCIPHFVTLIHVAEEIARDQSKSIIETLTEVEEKNLGKLNSELAEYVRRQSYEFSDKDRAVAEDVVLRGVERIAGRRGIRPVLLQKSQGVLFKVGS